MGGTPKENAEITRAILGGEKGPKRDAVVLNAAAALYAAVSYTHLDIINQLKVAHEALKGWIE